MEQLSRSLRWLPLCPEVAIGLGTPRPTLDLHRQNGEIAAYNRNNPDINPTQQLRAFADQITVRHPEICGYVFKSRSPSCALHSGRLYEGNQLISSDVAGLFAQRWKDRHPDIPAVESGELEDEYQRLRFVVRCHLVHGRRLIEKALPVEQAAIEETFRPLAQHLHRQLFQPPAVDKSTPELITELLMGEWPESPSASSLGASIRDLSQTTSGSCRALCRQLLAGAAIL